MGGVGGCSSARRAESVYEIMLRLYRTLTRGSYSNFPARKSPARDVLAPGVSVT